jgi:hypothetical protein
MIQHWWNHCINLPVLLNAALYNIIPLFGAIENVKSDFIEATESIAA